jgi:hypothetical protein
MDLAGNTPPAETRSAFRIDLNEDFVLELAVWFKRGREIRRVHLADLGQPQMTKGQPPHPRLENISANSLALSFNSGQAMAQDRFNDVLVLAYFKLIPPEGDGYEPLCLMTGFEVKGAKFYDGRMFLGLRLVYDAEPEPGEKVLRFQDARKYGIADLTKWCDDMNRVVRNGEYPRMPGFRLERLLSEIAVQVRDKSERAPFIKPGRNSPPS